MGAVPGRTDGLAPRRAPGDAGFSVSGPADNGIHDGGARLGVADVCEVDAYGVDVCEVDAVCITCSDQGRPARVVAPPRGVLGLAVVEVAGRREEVDVTLVGAVHPGDGVLIHAGTAIGRVGVDSVGQA
jgi:hydrogenase maturation factor